MSITKFRKDLGHFFKWPLLLLVGIFLASCFTWYGSNMFKGENSSTAGWLVKVNDQKVPREAFDNQMQQWSKQVEDMRGYRPSSAEVAMYKSQNLSQAVAQAALSQAADKQGIRISNGDVQNAIEKRIKDQMASDRQMVKTALEKRKKKATAADVDAELLAMIKIQKHDDAATIDSYYQGVRESFDPDQIKAQLAIQKLSENLARSGRMSEQEVIDSYRQVSFSHIQIKGSNDQAKHKADNVLRELKSGGDFAALAKENSDDQMTKAKGGAFFPITIGMAQGMRMDPTLTKAIFALPVGQVSDVLHTADGYEIVKVTGEKSTLPKDFQQKKKMYMDQALQMKRQQISSEFMQKVMKDAKVEVPDGDLKGYWLKQQATQAAQAGDFNTYSKDLKQAAVEFLASVGRDPGDAAAIYSLAQTYQALGQNQQAIDFLNTKVENKTTRTVSDADLHILLGDLYATTKDNAKAATQYGYASMIGVGNDSVHQQLMDKFKKVGRADLAAQEKAYVDKAQAMRKGAAGGGATPAPAPGG